MKKKLIGALLSVAMISSLVMGCGAKGTPAENTGDSTAEAEAPAESTDSTASNAAGGKVYYLNFKPEVEDAWKEIAAAYQEETGVEVKVVTAASGTYEEVLKSEIANTDAPTLFQINGPVGYNSWKDYCMDLTDTDLYKNLSDKSLAITGADGGVYGVPYTVESYGIIYNDAIMQKYFAMDGAVVSSVDEINNFATLKSEANYIRRWQTGWVFISIKEDITLLNTSVQKQILKKKQRCRKWMRYLLKCIFRHREKRMI